MIFACVLVLAAVVTAEPPQYRQRVRLQRQEVEVNATPYPPAGFKPPKEFPLPSRQEYTPPATSYGLPSRQTKKPPAPNGTPADSYSAPFNTYLTPQTEYGPPQDKQPQDKETTTTQKVEVETVETKTEAPKEKDKIKMEPKKDAEIVNTEGAYYVLLPGSQLQKVQFQTENDVRNMAYTTRLQYKDAEKAPVFIYTQVPRYQSAAYFQLYQ